MDTHTPVRFGITLFIEFFVCEFFIQVSTQLQIFYVSISTYFCQCIDDLEAIIGQKIDSIERCVSMKAKFVQFIELHVQLYRYFTVISTNLEKTS